MSRRVSGCRLVCMWFRMYGQFIAQVVITHIDYRHICPGDQGVDQALTLSVRMDRTPAFLVIELQPLLTAVTLFPILANALHEAVPPKNPTGGWS